MPDLTTFGADPIPTGPEGSYVPGDFMAYAESVDAKHVHTATSIANRDAVYAGLPAGKIVTCPSLGTVWMSLGGTPTQWQTIAYDSGWVTSGFTYPDAAWSAGSYRQARNFNGTIEVRMAVTRSGANFTTGADGNIADAYIAQIPTAFRPIGGYQVMWSGYMSGGNVNGAIDVAGRMLLQRGSPDFTYLSGAEVLLSSTYLAG